MKHKVGSFNTLCASIRKSYGAAVFDRIKASLTEPDRQELFGKPLLPISWIDYAAYVNFFVAADRIAGKGDFKLMHELVKEITKLNVNTFSKLAFRVASPDFMIPKAMSLWRQYYSDGVFSLVAHDSGHRIAALLSGAKDLPLHYEHDLSPIWDASLELLGVKTYTVQCTPYSDPASDKNCLFEITWSR